MFVNIFSANKEIDRLTGELSAAQSKISALEKDIASAPDASDFQVKIQALETEKKDILTQLQGAKDAHTADLAGIDARIEIAAAAKALAITQSAGAPPIPAVKTEKTDEKPKISASGFETVMNIFKTQITKNQ